MRRILFLVLFLFFGSAFAVTTGFDFIANNGYRFGHFPSILCSENTFTDENGTFSNSSNVGSAMDLEAKRITGRAEARIKCFLGSKLDRIGVSYEPFFAVEYFAQGSGWTPMMDGAITETCPSGYTADRKKFLGTRCVKSECIAGTKSGPSSGDGRLMVPWKSVSDKTGETIKVFNDMDSVQDQCFDGCSVELVPFVSGGGTNKIEYYKSAMSGDFNGSGIFLLYMSMQYIDTDNKCGVTTTSGYSAGASGFGIDASMFVTGNPNASTAAPIDMANMPDPTKPPSSLMGTIGTVATSTTGASGTTGTTGTTTGATGTTGTTTGATDPVTGTTGTTGTTGSTTNTTIINNTGTSGTAGTTGSTPDSTTTTTTTSTTSTPTNSGAPGTGGGGGGGGGGTCGAAGQVPCAVSVTDDASGKGLFDSLKAHFDSSDTFRNGQLSKANSEDGKDTSMGWMMPVPSGSCSNPVFTLPFSNGASREIDVCVYLPIVSVFFDLLWAGCFGFAIMGLVSSATASRS